MDNSLETAGPLALAETLLRRFGLGVTLQAVVDVINSRRRENTFNNAWADDRLRPIEDVRFQLDCWLNSALAHPAIRNWGKRR